MSSVARDPGMPDPAPVFIESEEEIPAVIERVTRADAEEVPLVLPARSRFGQSRFNFQLLRDYSQRTGKRVAIISPDPAVQRMAEENGFASFRAIDQYRPGERPVRESTPAAKVVPVQSPAPAPPDSDTPTKRVGVRVAPADAEIPPIPAPQGPMPSPTPVEQGPAGAQEGPARVVGLPSRGGAVPPLSPAPPAAPGAAVPPAGAGTPLAAPSVRPRQQAPVRVVPSRPPPAAAKRRAARIKVAAPRPLPSRLAAQAPNRIILYAGALLVLLVGMVATAVYVPSAKVTLVTEASPFNKDVEVMAEPNKAPIRVRTATVTRDGTMTQKASGVKTIPGAVASGTVNYANNCPTGFIIPDGQVLVTATGVQLAQKGAVTVGPKSIGPPAVVAASVVAKAPGAASNTPGGAVALQPAGDAGGCLVAVASPTAGGADEQKKTVVSTADYDTVKAALEGQLRKQAIEDLGKELQTGEKLADPTVTLDSAFKASRKVDEEGSDFQATESLKVEGAFYAVDDVNRAFGEVIQKQLPPGQQLTGNKAKIDYGVSAVSAGGHLAFKGKASGHQAPKLDLQKVKSQLPGKSIGKARTDLEKLPGVRSVEIDQSPIKLPILPLVGSRIDLQYVVSQAPPTRSG
jgi:hypothetical protein